MTGVPGYVTLEGGFTFSAWIWRDTPASWNTEMLFSQMTQVVPFDVPLPPNSIRQVYFGMRQNAGLVARVRHQDGTSRWYWVDENGDYAADQEWHHVAFRCTPVGTDRYRFAIFLDGEVLHEANDEGVIQWDAGALSIGADYAPAIGWHGNELWNGKLAYVVVANKALSNNRIQEHYNSGKGNAVFYGDDEVTRITRVFDYADVPEPSRQFDRPTTNLFGVRFADSVALDVAQEAATMAGGYLFADGQSRMVYHNRRRRNNRFVSALLTERLGASVEAGVTFVVDDERVYNDIRGRRPFGGTWRARDRESEAIYGRKTYSIELGVTSMEELRNAVTWFLGRYGRDHTRISEVRIRAESSDLLEYVASGGVEIGDVIALADLPEEAPTSYMEFVIEGMSLNANWNEGTWELELELSPHALNKVFEVGRSALGADIVAF